MCATILFSFPHPAGRVSLWVPLTQTPLDALFMLLVCFVRTDAGEALREALKPSSSSPHPLSYVTSVRHAHV
jgi:hypothetical protein